MLMERGDIAIAPQFAIRIRNSWRLVSQLRKASPKEDVLEIIYDLYIPINTRNPATSKAYINFTLNDPIGSDRRRLLVTQIRPMLPYQPI